MEMCQTISMHCFYLLMAEGGGMKAEVGGRK